MERVKIFTATYCPYCAAAKALLASKGVPFQEVDVTSDVAMRQQLVDMTNGRQTIPQIFVDGKPIGGYDDLVEFYKNGGSI